MKLNIKTKILGGFLTIIALLAVVSVIGWNGLNSLNDAVDQIVHEALPEDEEIRDLQFQIAVQSELFFEYALTLDDAILEEARGHSEIIEEELFQLEEQLAGETEMVAKLTQIEEEYEAHLHDLELVAADFAAGDTQASSRSRSRVSFSLNTP